MGSLSVSVALATFNGEKYLAEQLASILSQTYPVNEIVISDDASKDRTIDIIRSFQQNHSNIKLLEDKHTKGLNKNFERAVIECRGEAIAFSDQDNIWERDKLEKMVRRLGDHLLVYSDSLFVTADNQSIKRLSQSKKYKFTRGSTPKEFYFYNAAFGHNILFHRRLLHEALPFPENGLNYDGWISFVAACNGTIGYIDEPLVRYRYHPGNLTNSTPEKVLSHTPKDRKWQRVQRYNNQLLTRLEVYAAYENLAPKERRFLEKFIVEIKKQDQCYFNPTLLGMMLMNFRQLLHYKKTIKAVAKSFSQATGLKFPRLFMR